MGIKGDNAYQGVNGNRRRGRQETRDRGSQGRPGIPGSQATQSFSDKNYCAAQSYELLVSPETILVRGVWQK